MSEEAMKLALEAHGIDPSTPGLYGFYVDCISSTPQPAQRKPLTEAEIADTLPGYRLTDAIDIVRAVEAKHNTKDTTL